MEAVVDNARHLTELINIFDVGCFNCWIKQKNNMSFMLDLANGQKSFHSSRRLTDWVVVEVEFAIHMINIFVKILLKKSVQAN